MPTNICQDCLDKKDHIRTGKKVYCKESSTMPTNHIELLEKVLEIFENNFCNCDNCEICELRQEIEDYINNR